MRPIARHLPAALVAAVSLGCVGPSARLIRAAPGPAPHPDRAACAKGDVAACGRRGLALLRGAPDAKRDDAGAAAYLMLGCEGGDAPSCASLAALFATGRGVRKDDGRACELGLAEACARAERPAPATPVVPDAAAVEAVSAQPSGPAPEDAVTKALEDAESHVPRAVHADLGITEAAYATMPPLHPADRERFRPLLDAREKTIKACMPNWVGTDRRPAGSLAVSLVVDTDGRTSDVRVPLAPGQAPDVMRCLEPIGHWSFPRPYAAGRLVLFLGGDGPESPVPPDVAARLGRWEKPQELNPGCVGRSVHVPPALAGYSSAQILVKFAVGRDGSTSAFELVGGIAHEQILEEVRKAVASCAFRPAIGANGTPFSVWMILPLLFY